MHIDVFGIWHGVYCYGMRMCVCVCVCACVPPVCTRTRACLCTPDRRTAVCGYIERRTAMCGYNGSRRRMIKNGWHRIKSHSVFEFSGESSSVRARICLIGVYCMDHKRTWPGRLRFSVLAYREDPPPAGASGPGLVSPKKPVYPESVKESIRFEYHMHNWASCGQVTLFFFF